MLTQKLVLGRRPDVYIPGQATYAYILRYWYLVPLIKHPWAAGLVGTDACCLICRPRISRSLTDQTVQSVLYSSCNSTINLRMQFSKSLADLPRCVCRHHHQSRRVDCPADKLGLCKRDSHESRSEYMNHQLHVAVKEVQR